MRFLVLGAGLQGSACAFDLLRTTGVTQVRLADTRHDHLPPFLAPYSGDRLVPTPLDVRDHDAVRALMRQCDAVACALPYYLNLEMTTLAVECGVHYCDLGGNTAIVRSQKELNEQAAARGISVIPDCGLAPGLVNILAQDGIDHFDSVISVSMFVGGLPQNPEPPLNYQIVYSLEGMLDYLTTPSWRLRNGQPETVDPLTEIVAVQFAQPLGVLEAFHTAGGLSTMAERYAGRISTMEYKTLRYPGHAAIMKALRDLGLLSTEQVEVNGVRVAPRALFVAAAGPHLRKPGGRDLVALRVLVEGERGGQRSVRHYDLVDLYDEEHGISAMMRTTGYSLAITALMQARRETSAPGVHTPDESIAPQKFIGELEKRGVMVSVSEQPA